MPALRSIDFGGSTETSAVRPMTSWIFRLTWAASPRSASLPRGMTIDAATLEDALHALILPRMVGKTENGDEIIANVGRFGPYLRAGDAMRGLAAQLKRKIHEVIGLSADVSVLPPKSIERSAGKAKRVEDLRGKGGAAR